MEKINNQVRFKEWLFYFLVMGLFLAGCGNVGALQTPPIISATETSTQIIATETITQTLLPTIGGVHTGGPYRLEAIPWPEKGSLRREVEWDIDVVMRVEELPPGDYGIFSDDDYGLAYVSLEDLSQYGILATIPDKRIGFGVDAIGRIWGAGFDEDVYHYLVDFALEEAFEIGPLCEEGRFYFSSTGKWIAVNCKEWNGDEDDLAVYEFIQIESGKGFRIKLPYSFFRKFYWIDDDRFIISRVKYIDGRMSCIVDLEKLEMNCPKKLIGLEVIRLSLDRQYVILEKLQNGKNEWFVAHIDCFQEGFECSFWEPLDENISDWFIPSWSLDNSMMVIRTESYLEPWKFIIYGGTNWSEVITEIDNEGHNPLLMDWCPDSTCFFVEKRDISGITYLYWLDGTYEEMPYKNLRGVISVP